MSGHWQMKDPMWAIEITEGRMEGMLRGDDKGKKYACLWPTKAEALEFRRQLPSSLPKSRIVKVKVSYTEVKK